MPRTNNDPSGAAEAWRHVMRGYERALEVDGLPQDQRERLEAQWSATRRIVVLTAEGARG
jgi:hypothetical protein